MQVYSFRCMVTQMVHLVWLIQADCFTANGPRHAGTQEQANMKLWPRLARQSFCSGRDQQPLHGCVIARVGLNLPQPLISPGVFAQVQKRVLLLGW